MVRIRQGVRALSSMVEHLVDIQGAPGSIPGGRTSSRAFSYLIPRGARREHVTALGVEGRYNACVSAKPSGCAGKREIGVPASRRGAERQPFFAAVGKEGERSGRQGIPCSPCGVYLAAAPRLWSGPMAPMRFACIRV